MLPIAIMMMMMMMMMISIPTMAQQLQQQQQQQMTMVMVGNGDGTVVTAVPTVDGRWRCAVCNFINSSSSNIECICGAPIGTQPTTRRDHAPPKGERKHARVGRSVDKRKTNSETNYEGYLNKKKDNRWSNEIASILLDDIWSYLKSKELLTIIELVCRGWSHLSHRYGIGWHTLDLDIGKVWYQNEGLPWHALESLLTTRIIRHDSSGFGESAGGGGDDDGVVVVPRMSSSLRYLRGTIGSAEHALAIFNGLSSTSLQSAWPISMPLQWSRLQHITLTIRMLDDANHGILEQFITHIDQHQRLLTLSLTIERDNSHDSDQQDDRSRDDNNEGLPTLITIPSLPMLTQLHLVGEINIKFAVATTMPALERLVVKGEYYQPRHDEDDDDSDTIPTGGKGKGIARQNNSRMKEMKSTGKKMKSDDNDYEYTHLTDATFVPTYREKGVYNARIDIGSFKQWLSLVRTSLQRLHLGGIDYFDAIVNARLISLTSLQIEGSPNFQQLGKLTQLRHLHVPSVDVSVIESLTNLTSLQIMDYDSWSTSLIRAIEISPSLIMLHGRPRDEWVKSFFHHYAPPYAPPKSFSTGSFLIIHTKSD
jgi:hypothetical protein